MYTRSYNIRSQKDALSEPENTDPDIPKGYSGTAILRDPEKNESVDQIPEKEERQRRSRFSFSRVPVMHQREESENEKTAPICTVRSDDNSCDCIEPEAVCFEHEKLCVCPKHKKSDLEKLLLVALAVLILSERPDDILIMVIGFILI